jgi:acetolactate decarboxylase
VDTEFGDSFLGLGVLANLAGEVVSLDGLSYAVPLTGVPRLLEHNEGLAFAISARGGTQYHVELSEGPLNATTLQQHIDALIDFHHEDSEKIVATIRLHTIFSRVLLRTVAPPQSRSEGLETVIAHEQRFELHNWAGTLVGFRFPDNHSAHADPSVEAVDGKIIAGLHLHGISENRESGGHLHEFDIAEVCAQPIEIIVTLDELEAIS